MTTAVARPVHVEIWPDPQCVWCFIAHPRFEKAVALFDGEAEVTYRSFELRPNAPAEIDKEQQTCLGNRDPGALTCSKEFPNRIDGSLRDGLRDWVAGKHL